MINISLKISTCMDQIRADRIIRNDTGSVLALMRTPDEINHPELIHPDWFAIPLVLA